MIIDARTPVHFYIGATGYIFEAEDYVKHHEEIIDQIIAITRGLA